MKHLLRSIPHLLTARRSYFVVPPQYDDRDRRPPPPHFSIENTIPINNFEKQHLLIMYYVYITTNLRRNALYIGITNNLGRRLREHYAQKGLAHTFAGKYYCYGLIYVETFSQVEEAISREKELKGWKRSKKIALIETQNSAWTFLNDQYW